MGKREAAEVIRITTYHRTSISVRDDVWSRLQEWAREEKQPVELIIAEVLAANVGLG